MQLHTQDYDHMIVSHAKASAEAQKGLGHTLTQSAVLPSRDFNSWFFLTLKSLAIKKIILMLIVLSGVHCLRAAEKMPNLLCSIPID